MTCDAVVLTRLEWERLISCGWLRLHNARLVRVHDWLDPISATVHFAALMESAPDVGMSSSDYVLAELHYEVWTPVSQHNFQLGRIIKLEQVGRFSCFDERACKVLNATYNGSAEYATQVFQQPTLWIDWRKQMSKAWEDHRAARLLAHFNFSSKKYNQKFNFAFEKLIDAQHNLSRNSHYEHTKGTKAFGWRTALVISNRNPEISGCATESTPCIQSIVKKFQVDYDVDGPFFSGQSTDVANYVLSDPQYKKIREELVIFAAYAHYAYLIERSGYKKFSYEAFCQDVAWLEEKHIDLAVQLVEKIARYMVDELLWHVVSTHPSVPARPAPAALENSLVPPTEPVPESAAEPEKPLANDIAPTPETPSAPPVAVRPNEEAAQQIEAAVVVANSPEVQGSTTVVAEGVEAPETPIEPPEAVSDISDQPKTIGPEAVKGDSEKFGQAGATGREQSAPAGSVAQNNIQASLINEYSSEISTAETTGTSAPISGKTRRKFNSDYKITILQKVREKGIKQVCNEENLKPAYVKDWAKKFDQSWQNNLG